MSRCLDLRTELALEEVIRPICDRVDGPDSRVVSLIPVIIILR